MHRAHDRDDPHRPAERQAAARFARDEAADVLAEALWSLICAGRWPGARTGEAPPSVIPSARGRPAPQHVETTGG